MRLRLVQRSRRIRNRFAGTLEAKLYVKAGFASRTKQPQALERPLADNRKIGDRSSALFTKSADNASGWTPLVYEMFHQTLRPLGTNPDTSWDQPGSRTRGVALVLNEQNGMTPKQILRIPSTLLVLGVLKGNGVTDFNSHHRIREIALRKQPTSTKSPIK